MIKKEENLSIQTELNLPEIKQLIEKSNGQNVQN